MTSNEPPPSVRILPPASAAEARAIAGLPAPAVTTGDVADVDDAVGVVVVAVVAAAAAAVAVVVVVEAGIVVASAPEFGAAE